ncbi:MAG: PD-(D/E)XK nuclease family protein [Ruminococcus sp.]|nr:PD-(D/E)XK nuclease family protein [Ruminococcus sp.]
MNDRISNEADLISAVKDKINNKNENANLLSILRVNYKEVYICRLLCYLIDPKTKTGKEFLELFVKDALNITDFSLNDPEVSLEVGIDDKRRIDILITSETHIIPIEVKIFADDQKNQCRDYYKYAKDDKKDRELCFFYLTRYGNTPSKKSLGDLSENDVICISFSKEISGFINKCLVKIEDDKERLRAILEMLKESIDDFCGNSGFYNEIKNDVRAYMPFAKKINAKKNDDSVDNEARRLICAAYKDIVLKEILEKYYRLVMEKTEKLSEKYDLTFDYNDKYREIYFRIKQKYDNYDLVFTFMVYKPDSGTYNQRRPVVGMQVFKDKSKEQYDKNNGLFEKLKESYNISNRYHCKNWFDRDWFSDYYFDQRDNFKNIDDKVFDLLDDNEMEALVAETVEKIDAYISLRLQRK